MPLLLLALMTPARAADGGSAPDHPVTLGLSLGGAVGPASSSDVALHGTTGGGFGGVRALFHVGDFAVDLGGRTGLLANDLREVTQISLGARWEPGVPYARVGFVHSHETPWEVLTERPLESTVGSAPGIRHRSGGEVALGLRATLLPHETEGRFSAWAEAAAVGFPDDRGPAVYGQLDLGVGMALGPDRSGG
ncbi:hypothetical protein L6R53_03925 [Myxococcota bacterium]|nr:hypothetical protein [Myxococcota bacterium]